MRTLFLVMIISLALATFWHKVPFIKQSVGLILNPTAGKLLNYNANIGMIIFAGVISLFITLIQKYTTDQETLREIKKEQKLLQQEIKKWRM